MWQGEKPVWEMGSMDWGIVLLVTVKIQLNIQ